MRFPSRPEKLQQRRKGLQPWKPQVRPLRRARGSRRSPALPRRRAFRRGNSRVNRRTAGRKLTHEVVNAAVRNALPAPRRSPWRRWSDRSRPLCRARSPRGSRRGSPRGRAVLGTARRRCGKRRALSKSSRRSLPSVSSQLSTPSFRGAHIGPPMCVTGTMLLCAAPDDAEKYFAWGCLQEFSLASTVKSRRAIPSFRGRRRRNPESSALPRRRLLDLGFALTRAPE